MITYKTLADFTPLNLKYNFFKDEQLQKELFVTYDGLRYNKLDLLTNFKDVSINRGSCFLLTSAVCLSSFFAPSKQLSLGNLPGSVILQSQNNSTNYIGYDTGTNTFVTSNVPAIFLLYPINEQEVEIKVNSKYLQVDVNYPYIVRLNSISLDSQNINRQRFVFMYQNNILTLRTKTNAGFRYLAMTKDENLKATGLNLNNATLHNYALRAIDVTTTSYNYGFTPTNNWVTYYQDFGNQTNNETVAVNKLFSNIPSNFLIDFPIDESIETAIANINVANLKTSLTPAGGPTPIDNSYTENIITTN